MEIIEEAAAGRAKPAPVLRVSSLRSAIAPLRRGAPLALRIAALDASAKHTQRGRREERRNNVD
jgi:hypothetical protein